MPIQKNRKSEDGGIEKMEKRQRKIIVIDGYGGLSYPIAVTEEIDRTQMYLEIANRPVIVICGRWTSKKMRRRLRKHGCETIFRTDLTAELESM